MYFSMTFLTKKLPYKNSYINFDAFSRQNGSFIFPENRGTQNESVKIAINIKSSSRIKLIFFQPLRYGNCRDNSNLIIETQRNDT